MWANRSSLQGYAGPRADVIPTELLEDNLFELQFEYEDALEKLERAEQELKELKNKNGDSDTNENAPQLILVGRF